MMARGEPGYANQVPRREEYEAAYPEVKITYHGGWWQAVIPEEAGTAGSACTQPPTSTTAGPQPSGPAAPKS